MQARTTWLSDAEKDLVYEEALLLLEHVGLRMAGSQRLGDCVRRGAAVDDGDRASCASRRSSSTDCAASARARSSWAARHPSTTSCCATGRPRASRPRAAPRSRSTTAPASAGPRPCADLRDATILLDETPELDVQWTTVTANDVPLEQREKVEYYTVLTETDKHVTFVDCPSAIEPVLAIVEVLCGSLDEFRRRPRISTLFTVASPLSLDGRLLDFHARLADYGTPIEIYTVPISGATAPVTLAGVVVQGVAELLGAVAAMQILSPGARLICGPSGAILDMRSTSICYGALEGGLLNAAFTEVLHDLGLPVTTPGLGTDAKHLGVQDGFEKALKAIVTVAAGSDLLSGGMGLIDSVNTLYLPQIVVDAEIVAMIRRLLGEVEFTPETMARDMIERVGIGGQLPQGEGDQASASGPASTSFRASRRGCPTRPGRPRARPSSRRPSSASRRSSPPGPSAART